LKRNRICQYAGAEKRKQRHNYTFQSKEKVNDKQTTKNKNNKSKNYGSPPPPFLLFFALSLFSASFLLPHRKLIKRKLHSPVKIETQ